MFYTVYKITNKINGKYYIGMHRTNNLNDGYMGSGKILKKAILKYGIENFVKEILFVFDNEKDMKNKEKELVVISEMSYNMNEGGHGGFGYINSSGINKGANNVMVRYPDKKELCILKAKQTRASNPEFYNQISRKNISVAIKNQIGKKRPEHSKIMKERGEIKKDGKMIKNI